MLHLAPESPVLQIPGLRRERSVCIALAMLCGLLFVQPALADEPDSESGQGVATIEAPHLERVVAAWIEGQCASVERVQSRPVEAQLAWLYDARCAFDEGRFDDAIKAFRIATALEAIEHRELRRSLSWYDELEARYLLHDGSPADALQAWEVLLEGAPGGRVSSAARARRTYYLALAHERAGDTNAAIVLYHRLAHDHAGDPMVARALPRAISAPPAPAILAERADNALSGRHYAAAETLFTRAACGGLPYCTPQAVLDTNDPARIEAAWRLGHLLYRFRREHVERGIPWLRALSEHPHRRQTDAAHTLGLALMRAGHNEEARDLWNTFRYRWPADRRAEDALFYLGWMPQIDRQWEESIPGLERFLASHPRGARARNARWWIGWAHYRIDACEAASDWWQQLERGHGLWWTVQSLYWQGVCQEKLGHQEEATALFERVEREMPLSWYAFLARRRQGLSPVPEPDEGWPRLQQPRPHPDLAERLAMLGLHDEAVLVDRIEQRDSDDERLARVYSHRQDWLRWRRLHLRATREVPDSARRLRQWRLVYPDFYASLVRQASRDHGLPPSVIRAVMQQESAFDRRAISVSDAMGLMQVIPQTAQAIAMNRQWRYVDGMLFEPVHAVRFGTWYLGALREQFGGQLPVAIGAYNAGPIAMFMWIDRSGDRPIDEFVEEITFDQARDYIKRVTTWAVRYLIAHEPPEQWLDDELGGLLPHMIQSGYGPYPDF